MLGITFGLGEVIDGGSYLPAPVPPGLSQHFGAGKFLGLYYPIWVAPCSWSSRTSTFQYTRFGRYTRAVGSNDEATRRAGIAVDWHVIKVYTLAGFMAGVAAIVDLAIYTNTTAVSHRTDNLDAISAVVLGGTSLFGGVGSILMSASARSSRPAPERARDQGRAAVLAGGRRRRDRHLRRLPRPVAPPAQELELRGRGADQTAENGRPAGGAPERQGGTQTCHAVCSRWSRRWRCSRRRRRHRIRRWSAPAEQQNAQKTYNFVLVAGIASDAYYLTMNKGAGGGEEARQHQGRAHGLADRRSRPTQIPFLNGAIARKPDAILIAPTDKNALIAPIQRAIAAGIPVVTVDTFISRADRVHERLDGQPRRRQGRRATRSSGDRRLRRGRRDQREPGISTTDRAQQGFERN